MKYLSIFGCVILLGMVASMALAAPTINDITTDLENPPVFVHLKEVKANQGRDMSYPREFAPKQAKHYRNLGGMAFSQPASEIFECVIQIAQKQKRWEIVATDRDAYRLEAIATTLVFRFKDDVVIEVRTLDQEHSGKSVVEMRSKSRVGKGDLGKNAKRIQSFFEALTDIKKRVGSGNIKC